VKKLVLAVVIVFIVLMATNYLVHGVILMPDYDAIPASHRTADGLQQRLWELAVGQLFFAAIFAYVYTRGVEKKSWAGQGVRYAIMMTFLTIVPNSLSEYDVFIVPYQLVLKWIVAGGIQLLIVGLIVAGIYRAEAGAR
jgi:hypothetical protein